MEPTLSAKKIDKKLKNRTVDFPSQSGTVDTSLEFANLYKSTAETSIIINNSLLNAPEGNKENSHSTKNKKHKSLINDTLPQVNNSGESEVIRSVKKGKKKNRSLDVSKIPNDDDTNELNITTNPGPQVNQTKMTSTPNIESKKKQSKIDKSIKPIIKSVKEKEASDANISSASVNGSTLSFSTGNKGKKRNKSVSFVLDEDEETKGTSNKKTKSDGSISIGDFPIETIKTSKKNKKFKTRENTSVNHNFEVQECKASEEVTSEDTKPKNKTKNKKRDRKSQDLPSSETEKQIAENAEEEPKRKKSKKPKKSGNIEENLENLSIGDNPTTIANLFDEMKVAEKKSKKKKNKDAKNMIKDKKGNSKGSASPQDVSEGDLEKIEEGKEKVKWNKRKWNKDKKGGATSGDLITSVIIENLPLSLMTTYKKLLAEHFSKYGLIRRVGVVELYPAEEPKPVFTTTIYFDSEAAASQALEEDNMPFQGFRIRVRRPLPPTETTLVVRSFKGCTEQTMSSIFAQCGKIRNIRELTKGGRSISTAFIEFDGPESVERAIKIAEDAKIGGKKIFVSKFEVRTKAKKQHKEEEKLAETQEKSGPGDSDES